MSLVEITKECFMRWKKKWANIKWLRKSNNNIKTSRSELLKFLVFGEFVFISLSRSLLHQHGYIFDLLYYIACSQYNKYIIHHFPLQFLPPIALCVIRNVVCFWSNSVIWIVLLYIYRCIHNTTLHFNQTVVFRIFHLFMFTCSHLYKCNQLSVWLNTFVFTIEI